VPQGALFVVGTVTAVIGVAGLAWLWLLTSRVDVVRPDRGNDAETFDFRTLTLRQTWQAWQEFSEIELTSRTTPAYLANRQYVNRLRKWMVANGVLGGVGLVLAAVAVLLRPARRPAARRTSPRDPAAP
jgi:hypothetical protein